MTTNNFQELVWQHGRELYRDMPWRSNPRPYYVWVSELMLQQTQVSRVIPKFEAFMQRFPTISDLAQASLADVLVNWNGLGYNRRAKFLWQAAQEIEQRYSDKIPNNYRELISLPGIGPNTAAAICNYAFQVATPFVETNIRTVYFHHFFADDTNVSDGQVLARVEATMDKEHPREWFWALMDYGTYLKSSAGGRLDQSKHYKKQSPLKGSLREMRGRIIRVLGQAELSETDLYAQVKGDERFAIALNALHGEGMTEQVSGKWRLTSKQS